MQHQGMLPAGTQFDVFRGTAAAKADETDDYPVGGGEGRERTRESSERYGVTRHPTIGAGWRAGGVPRARVWGLNNRSALSL